jgi:phosphatidate cytidylyltransferase
MIDGCNFKLLSTDRGTQFQIVASKFPVHSVNYKKIQRCKGCQIRNHKPQSSQTTHHKQTANFLHPIFSYIIIFLVIGGIGMAAGSRHVDAEIKKQRWLKYFMYIIITGVVIISMFTGWFQWLAAFILLAGLVEIVRPRPGASLAIAGMAIFALVGAGFWLFARKFNYSFQLFIYFQVLVFDGFCQVSGQLFGKHALAPKISPAKTWEGWIGGWVVGVLASILCAGWLPVNDRLLFGLVTGLIMGLIAGLGDLLASWYKRRVHIKDYSNWLPGQGGFLDRFDSFLMTGALCYVLSQTIFAGVLAHLID